MSMTNNQGVARRKNDVENDRMVQEFLDKGGTITACQANTRTAEAGYSNRWGKRKAKPKEETPTT
jgi:hypothetical protein